MMLRASYEKDGRTYAVEMNDGDNLALGYLVRTGLFQAEKAGVDSITISRIGEGSVADSGGVIRDFNDLPRMRIA